MINPQDNNYQPQITEIDEYINNPLFDEFHHYLVDNFQASYSIEYSRDSNLQGWNIKFRKAGRALCVVYPRHQAFLVLVVIGKKEKDRVERLLPTFQSKTQQIYRQSPEGNNQRWLLIELNTKNKIYQDILQLIQIRREKPREVQND